MLLVELDTNRIINIEVLLPWDEAMFLSERKLEDSSTRTSMKLSPGGARQYQNDQLTAIQRVAVSHYDAEFEIDMPLGKLVLNCRSVRVLQLKILQDINRLGLAGLRWSTVR